MRILPEGSQSEKWLTTVNVARMLAVSPRGVRWLARERRIRFEETRAGQRLFRVAEVERVVLERARERGCSRRELLKLLRPRMLRVGLEPRQLALFRKVKASERVLPEAEVKRSTLVRKSA
jgi:DNA-binding transcriptional MerR regulator